MMRALRCSLVASAIVAASACVGPPIRYVAVTMPEEIPALEVRGQHAGTVSGRGFLYPGTVDIAGSLAGLHAGASQDVLLNVSFDASNWGVVCYWTCVQWYEARAASTVPFPVNTAVTSAAPRPAPVAPPVTTAAAAPVAVGGARVIQGTSLLGRPNASGDVLQALAPGATVQVASCMSNADGAWCFVRAEGRGGWVREQALSQE